jgi:hypothetical protein
MIRFKFFYDKDITANEINPCLLNLEASKYGALRLAS